MRFVDRLVVLDELLDPQGKAVGRPASIDGACVDAFIGPVQVGKSPVLRRYLARVRIAVTTTAPGDGESDASENDARFGQSHYRDEADMKARAATLYDTYLVRKNQPVLDASGNPTGATQDVELSVPVYL